MVLEEMDYIGWDRPRISIGGDRVDQEKVHAIMELVQGMKRSEWDCIVHAVNRKFDEEAARVRMSHEMVEGAVRLVEIITGS